MRKEAAGDAGPSLLRAVSERSHRVANALRDVVRDYTLETDAVLVIDETGFLKRGKASRNVARRYAWSARKITNY